MAASAVSKGKRPLRALSASDKIEAIQRVNDGESKASVARQIGVPESTLRGWCKNEDKLRYMSSRHSTPDTDKSSDGLESCSAPPEKRAKYDAALDYSATETNSQGLDLSRLKEAGGAEKPVAESTSVVEAQPDDEQTSSKTKVAADLGASISMSAISPLSSTLNHLTTGMSAINQSHLGMSFNEIATNLSLIAQLNPALNTLANSINSNAKMLRSVRSPKPGNSNGNAAVNGGTSMPNSNNNNNNVTDKHKSERKSQNHLDSYGESKTRSRSSHNSYKDLPVDDTLWYWFKKQQAMLNLANSTGGQLPMSLPHSTTSNRSGKDSSSSRNSTSLSSLPTMMPSMDKNSWFWQYYKQFASSLGIHEDKLKGSPQPESYEQMLYSYFAKEKIDFTQSHSEVNNLNHKITSTENHKDLKKKSEEKIVLDDRKNNLMNALPNMNDCHSSNTIIEKKVSTSPPVTDGIKNINSTNIIENINNCSSPKPEDKKNRDSPNIAERNDRFSPNEGIHVKNCNSPSTTERSEKDSKSQTKMRTVLDNLLLLNNNNEPVKESNLLDENEKDSNAENEYNCEVSEALEHGDKFLKWLEACQEPSVTRMQVHQLRGLLTNIKANVARRSQDNNSKDRISRRK